MNLNVAKQYPKTQKSTQFARLFGGLASHEAMVTRTLEYCAQQVGVVMQVDSCQITKQNFQDGELASVNNTQGPLLILHLTNMSPQCKVNLAKDLNQNKVYKA